MGRSDLTIQVLNLSPKVTPSELNTFFSYCGTVEEATLHKNKDQSQSAFVTFSQPYAYEIALLLNEAIFAGEPIRVLPAQDTGIPHTIPNKSKHGVHDPVPAAQAASEDVGPKGVAKHSPAEKFRLSEKGRELAGRTRSAINTVEQATDHIVIAIKNNTYISNGATWLSGALDKASKSVSAMATRKPDNPNSRKHK